MLKLDLFEGFTMSIFSMLLFAFILLSFFNPFRCCYRSVRGSLFSALAHILIAPFGLVRFRHFFLADVLTSFVKPLVDIRYCLCFFVGTVSWLHDDRVTCENGSPTQRTLNLVITLLPYWVRFLQCFHKYFETRLKSHLFNALKYGISLLIPVVSSLYHDHPDTYLVPFLLTSILGAGYSFFWDIYMDWGLLRRWKTPNFGLRRKLLYPSAFYYQAVLIDLFLRFAWLVSLYPALLLDEFWGLYF